jgi:hypothetical protein
LRATIARPRDLVGHAVGGETKWFGTMWPVSAEPERESPVSTLPLSGMPFGWTTS